MPSASLDPTLRSTVTIWSILISLLIFCTNSVFAQEEDSAADDAGNRHITATGTDLFAVPIPGETYAPLTGKIGHRSTDMSITGNGALSIAITRQHEETPQAYPYALGTMSLGNPRLSIAVGVTSSEYKSPAARTLNCSTWNKSIDGGDIRFEHPGGMVRLLKRHVLQNALLSKFPSNALFISNDNWYVSCGGAGSDKFIVHSPDGTSFTTGVTEWYPSRGGDDGVYTVTYVLFAETIEKHGSTISYEYVDSPQTNGQVLPPLANLFISSNHVIRNKQRLNSITLDDGSTTDRKVNFTYRSGGSAICPHLLDRVGSSAAPNNEVFYKYKTRNIAYQAPYTRTQCELSQVLLKDGSHWDFEYDQYYTMSSHEGTRNSNNDLLSEERILKSRTLYLPMIEVSIPTGAKTTYKYQLLKEKNYKSLPYDSSTHRPAVKERTVADPNGNSFQNSTHTVSYSIATPVGKPLLAQRQIFTSGLRYHKLLFNRVDRISNPKSTVPSEVSARARSSKLKSHYVYAIDSKTPLSGIEHEYDEKRNFLDANKYSIQHSRAREWVLNASRDNLVKSTIHFDGNVFEKRWRGFDIYNQPSFIDEHNVSTDEKRSSWIRYDNNYANKNGWIVGLIDRIYTGTYIDDVTVGNDKIVIQRTYNSDGQLASETDQGFTTSFGYNPYGALTSSTDGRNNTTMYKEYNNGVAKRVAVSGGVDSVTSAYVTGRIYKTIDEAGVRLDYRYDSMGRMNKTWKAGDTRTKVTTYHPTWHDPNHWRYRSKKELNESGWSRFTYYDALGRVVQIVERDTSDGTTDMRKKTVYDQYGRTVNNSYASASDLGGGTWPGVNRTYDAVDRIITENRSGNAGEVSYCYGKLCNAHFGTNGKIDFGYARKDEDGYITVYNFRALGNASTHEVSEIHQMIDDTEWVGTWLDRNIHGFITKVLQGANRGNATVRTYTPFAMSSTLTMLPGSETHPEFGTRVVNGYDGAGNMTQVSNFSSNMLTYTYTNRNQLDTVSASDGSYSVDYDYLPNGFLQKMSTPNSAWTYVYKPGYALLESEALTIDGQTLSLSYTYDNVDNLSTLTYPNGTVATYRYNGFGQPVSLTVDSGEGAVEFADGALYFPNGQLRLMNMSNGLTFSSTQNLRTLPQQLKVSKFGAPPPLDLVYLYDARQNIKNVGNYFYHYSGGGGITATYDGLNRLITASGSAWGPNGVVYEYDLLGNIKRASLDGYALTYTYPGSSNLLSSVTVEGDHTKARNYSNIQYDANGNITSTSDMDSMSYDEMNQMLTSSHYTGTDGEVEISNRYDGQGFRVKAVLEKDGRTKSTYSLYSQSGNLMFEQDVESGEQRNHLFFNGKSIATLGTHNSTDSDTDGVPDYFERLHGMDPYLAIDALEDADGDGLSNLNEYLVGSLVMSADSDNNGIGDEIEYEILDGASHSLPNPHWQVPVTFLLMVH